jgi:hypothetical protein
MEIFPQLFMLPQVNDGCRFLAAFIHHESDSAHGSNLAEKCVEVNLNLTSSLTLKARRAGIFVVGKSKTAKAP